MLPKHFTQVPQPPEVCEKGEVAYLPTVDVLYEDMPSNHFTLFLKPPEVCKDMLKCRTC